MATAPVTFCGYEPVYTESTRVTWNSPTAAGVAAAGAAGTYTATVLVPANALLLDVILHGVALWNAGTSATGKVGDADDDDRFFTDVNLKATDLLAGESIALSGGTGLSGGQEGADIANSHWLSRWSTSVRTIKLIVTLVGTAATTGETILQVVWARRPDARPGGRTIPQGVFVAT